MYSVLAIEVNSVCKSIKILICCCVRHKALSSGVSKERLRTIGDVLSSSTELNRRVNTGQTAFVLSLCFNGSHRNKK